MWSNERYLSRRGEAINTVRAEREKLDAFIAASKWKSFLPKALEWVLPYFKLATTPGVPITEEKEEAWPRKRYKNRDPRNNNSDRL